MKIDIYKFHTKQINEIFKKTQLKPSLGYYKFISAGNIIRYQNNQHPQIAIT